MVPRMSPMADAQPLKGTEAADRCSLQLAQNHRLVRINDATTRQHLVKRNFFINSGERHQTPFKNQGF